MLRSLNDIKKWKLAEWRNRLLDYSPVLLRGLLPSKYYNYWMKFVEVMLGSSLCVQKLRDLWMTMFTFVKKYAPGVLRQTEFYVQHASPDTSRQ